LQHQIKYLRPSSERRKEGDGAGAEEPGISGIVEEELLGNN
jgi:hypothetical protein